MGNHSWRYFFKNTDKLNSFFSSWNDQEFLLEDSLAWWENYFWNAICTLLL